jgi:hypothetical protein
MAIEVKMNTLLGGTTSITDIISSSLFVSMMPQNTTMPAIVYKRVRAEPLYYLGGDSSAEHIDLEVSCYATAYKASLQLSTVVHRVMYGSTTFKALLLSNRMEVVPINDRKNLFNTLLLFNVWDKE